LNAIPIVRPIFPIMGGSPCVGPQTVSRVSPVRVARHAQRRRAPAPHMKGFERRCPSHSISP
jgi:hypothetical protein